MLNVEDPRSWFAIAALATALVFMAGTAQGTLRDGSGRGGNGIAAADSSAIGVSHRMADEGRRCSYFEPACQAHNRAGQAVRPQAAASTGSGYPVPPRGVNMQAPRHNMVLPGRG